MGMFDSFFTGTGGDDDVEYQSKGTGRGLRRYLVGDTVQVFPYDRHTGVEADDPLEVTDFAIAAFASDAQPNFWWMIVRDGKFTEITPEDAPPSDLPLFDNYGQPTVHGASVGYGSNLPDPPVH